MNIQAQWIKLEELEMNVYGQSFNKNNEVIVHSFEVPNKYRSMRILNFNKNSSFAIEAFPADEKHVNCLRGLRFLAVAYCGGPIQARELNEFD